MDPSERNVLVFKTREDALAPVGADADATNAEGWDRWVKAHLANERAETVAILTKVIGEFASEYVHEKLQPLRRELADVKAENAEVKRMLGEALTRCAKVEEEAKGFATMLDLECKNHDATVHKFELQVAEMRGRLSGVLRDYVP